MFDLQLLGKKLNSCRSRLEYTVEEVVNGTGINKERLNNFEKGILEPTGDEILILADFFKEDYKFFISNQQSSASENADKLYRQFGNEFSKEDRRRIQEFLYLCECESDIWELLGKTKKSYKLPTKKYHYLAEPEEIAREVREFIGYKDSDLLSNIFDDFRKLGLHIFRRELSNSSLSGIFIQHPIAGKCILVNYSEDLYRQNFTLVHEVAHSIFDTDVDYNVSFTKDGNDIKEIRANRFAAAFLMPAIAITKLKIKVWNDDILIKLAKQFKVNIVSLLIRLKSLKFIQESDAKKFEYLRLPRNLKEDPELKGLPEKIARAKSEALKRGLSATYIRECHEAYTNSLISQSRLAEMLLISEEDLIELLSLFNLKLIYEF